MPLPPVPTVRAASLKGLERLAREFKVDEVALMHRVGLSPRVLADPDARVSLLACCQLLEAFARCSGREDVGLLLTQGRRLSNLGGLGLVSALQATLRQALQVIVQRRGEVVSGLMVVLEEQNGIGVLRVEYVLPGAPYPRQATEHTISVLVQLMRQFLGADWTPRRVCFKHPPPADLRTHRRVLGWAVEFEHDFNAIVLTSQDLDAGAPLQDPELAELAARNQPASVGASSTSQAQRCREHLSVLLPQGISTIDHVASRMGLQRRTLQRRLDQEGMTFNQLLQSLREDLVQTYLNAGDVPLADVATRLGFSAPSAFSRWHRATFGTSARERSRRD